MVLTSVIFLAFIKILYILFLRLWWLLLLLSHPESAGEADCTGRRNTPVFPFYADIHLTLLVLSSIDPNTLILCPCLLPPSSSSCSHPALWTKAYKCPCGYRKINLSKCRCRFSFFYLPVHTSSRQLSRLHLFIAISTPFKNEIIASHH